MITLQHTQLYLLALSGLRSYRDDKKGLIAEFEKGVPWVLLPDAIRKYTGSRQPSHFEWNPDRSEVSKMKFPSKETLRSLTEESKGCLVCEKAYGYHPCMIGEDTDLVTFDQINIGHPHYHSLRIHLIQDIILDRVLREQIIDPSQRFLDRFVVRHNRSMVLNGEELRTQIAQFERLGFIMLARIVFERTGILMNNEWLNAVVYQALSGTYSKELADQTFKYMKLDGDTERRICNHDFELTKEDAALVPMVKDLETLDTILADMYVKAYNYSRQEL